MTLPAVESAVAVGQGELVRARKAQLVRACRVGPEAGGIALVAHVPDEELMLRVAQLQFGLELTGVDHAGAQAVAQEDDPGLLLQPEGLGRLSRGPTGKDRQDRRRQRENDRKPSAHVKVSR